MRLLAVLQLILCLQLAVLASAVREDEELFGWQEFRLKFDSDSTAEAVRQYASAMDFLVANENHLAYPESVVVPPAMAPEFATFLSHQGVKFDILEKDVGGMLLKVKLDNERQSATFNSDPSTFFAQSSIILDWIQKLGDDNQDIATVENIGASYEGRRLLILKLSTDGGARKPVIFLDAAIHAREWLAAATLNYIVKEFISDYRGGNPGVKALLDKYDWHFMPVVNPDGYDYTFRSSSTRYWRKTRKPYGSNYGADPNRNFDFMFGGIGTSNNPSSDIYHGPNAFSEPETKALSVYLTGLGARLQNGMYISFHTYGQYWMTPPGYTSVNPPDHAEMMRIGNIARDAISQAGGPTFGVGQPANIGLYEATGGSYDWVKFRLGVTYSFTLELRPGPGSGLNGFAPSASVIPNSGREVYSAVKAAVNARP